MVELNQYYTSESTSFLLASMLDVENVHSCLELSAGKGALIDPIKALNDNIRFTTVDLDGNNTDKLIEKYPDDIHMCSDALDINLNLEANYFDLAVCNPPFTYIDLSDNYKSILGQDFNFIFNKSSKIRAEVLFIIRNLFFLKEGATLAVIVPDFIFSSYSLSKFREVLFSRFTLTKVIDCEYKSFKKTEAKTYVLFIKKIEPVSVDNSVPYFVFSSGNIKKDKILLSSTFIKKNKVDNIGYTIFRGINSSKECRLLGEPFHHNYAHVKDLSNVYYFSNSEKKTNFKYAFRGDILIHRVGRNIGRTVILDSEYVIISDCVIVLRFHNVELKKSFLDYWASKKNEWISNNQKGTCAKNISINSFKNLISSLR
ncbi:MULTISPECIES: N-6 DNA methylase [Marinomonas]|uniref:site-specific DNA-methyltransferase (adenine-specific) n=1 Tax=Marinomonas arctica TaxID=383750 RepID=A0A7H1JAP3_9GAMM|nr:MULTISPECIES: N-6 DNA methylase [Marinomonas]MCS7487665.1 hypothetical protein [Marinomonas sp. BSi20414]QNT07559.1 N-6 DNA methylase [Marinomonas arctica]